MAYQVGSACYSTPAQAAQASASAQLGAFVQNGSLVHVVEIAGVTDTSITYTLRPVSGGVPITISSAYQAQPCGLLTASDGVSLGWMVVAVWLAVYSLMFIARTVREMLVNDGDT